MNYIEDGPKYLWVEITERGEDTRCFQVRGAPGASCELSTYGDGFGAEIDLDVSEVRKLVEVLQHFLTLGEHIE